MNTEKYGDELIECKICGYKKLYLNQKHFDKHNISRADYLLKFNLKPSDLMNKKFIECRSITLDHLIDKYGNVVGKEKFDEYCKKQSNKNKFEFKQKKYGWDSEQFDKFNKSRAITLDNMIKKYGDAGVKKYDEYCRKQAYAGVTKEYFIEKYGIIAGYEKWLAVGKSKAITLDSMIKRHGEIIGKRKHEEWLKRLAKNKSDTIVGVSHIANELFKQIDKHTTNKTYYMFKDGEYFLYDDIKGKCYFLDYYDIDTNKIIEFHGDYWHCNPRFYNKDYFNFRVNKTAQEIWDNDKRRETKISDLLKAQILVVWEHDYRHNKDDVINNILNFLGYKE